MEKPFHICTSQLLLTYKCQKDLPGKEIYEQLCKMFKPLLICVVEKDEESRCYLKLSKQLQSTNPNFADLGSIHGTYGGCRSNKKILRDCTMEGEKNFLANFEVRGSMKARKQKKKLPWKDEITTIRQPLPKDVNVQKLVMNLFECKKQTLTPDEVHNLMSQSSGVESDYETLLTKRKRKSADVKMVMKYQNQE